MTSFVKQLLNDESGATAIEYGLIAALIAVALVTVLGTLSGSLGNIFTAIGGQLDNAAGNL